MKRKNFVTALLALSAAPLAFGTQTQEKISREMKGIKISANEGRIHGHLKLKVLTRMFLT
jgi:hypothetical protein